MANDPALLELLGWDAVGLRVPDHALDFTEPESGSAYRASVIQMPNGTGKTTTLELLRAALSGAAASWTPDRVHSFQKRHADNDSGVFRLRCRVLGRLWTVELRFDFEERTVRYYSTLPSGQKEGFQVPRSIASLARPDLVEFFVFDGELAERLLDAHQMKADLAIEQFFRLDLLQRMKAEIQRHWESVTRDRTAKQEKGLNRRLNLLGKLTELLKTRTQESEGLKDTIQRKKSELERLESRFQETIDASAARRELHHQLKRKQQRLESRRDQEVQKAVGLLRSPINVTPPFAVEAERFKERLDRVKLPESAAREFFEELAEEPDCICGRPLGSSERAEIRHRASTYLGSDNVALLNALKTDVVEALARGEGKPWMPLEECLQELAKLTDMLGEVDTELSAIQIETAREGPDQETAFERIGTLRAEIKIDGRELEAYEASEERGTPEENVKSLAELERRRLKAERDVAEIADTLLLARQRDKLTRVLEVATDFARESLHRAIVDRTNGNIERLLPYNAISIKEIDRALLLDGQEGGSVGETLSIAYSFLATLSEYAVSRLPLVVDSPAGPIDLAVRPQVAALVPRLTHQFVAFTISTERAGFVEPLAKSLDGNVQYVTLFRAGDPKLEASARAAHGTQVTTDGFLVVDHNYFSAFHVNGDE